MVELGVNVDHVATVRQARRTYEPDPVWAAVQCELAGADQITVHLREDRRHIQDRDVEVLVKTVQTRVNLEMAVSAPILRFALRVRPACACLVPEKRQEVTTEGGLDIVRGFARIKQVTGRLKARGIAVSHFIDADPKQIEAAAKAGADSVELHTGTYANARSERARAREFKKLASGGALATELGLRLHAGHGLNYLNVGPVADLPKMRELNIGHALVARAIFCGLPEAVREMKRLIHRAAP